MGHGWLLFWVGFFLGVACGASLLLVWWTWYANRRNDGRF